MASGGASHDIGKRCRRARGAATRASVRSSINPTARPRRRQHVAAHHEEVNRHDLRGLVICRYTRRPARARGVDGKLHPAVKSWKASRCRSWRAAGLRIQAGREIRVSWAPGGHRRQARRCQELRRIEAWLQYPSTSDSVIRKPDTPKQPPDTQTSKPTTGFVGCCVRGSM